MSTKTVGFNVIKSLKLNKGGLFFLTPVQESTEVFALPRKVAEIRVAAHATGSCCSGWPAG